VKVPANAIPDGGELEAAEPAEHAATNAQHTSSSQKRLLIVGTLGPAGINLRPVRAGVFRQHPEVLLVFPLWHLGVFPLFPVYDPASIPIVDAPASRRECREDEGEPPGTEPGQE
jgi:hypothetical protein